MSITNDRIISVLLENGILPVVCLKSEEELKTFIEAVIKTPIKCIEILMRHPYSKEVIKYIKNNHPDIIVGAGTIVNSSLLDEVIELGVDFCVSPGFDEELVSEAIEKGMPFVPGCSIPSEFLKAQKYNMKMIKLFPAECSGGINALKLYKDAFSGMWFLPTGGINLNNYIDYIACGNVIACGGGFMVPKNMLNRGNSEGIAETINNCIVEVREVRG